MGHHECPCGFVTSCGTGMLQHEEECEIFKQVYAVSLQEVVHILVKGYTPCTLEGIPKDWPKGHRWSHNPADITCPECLTIFEGLEEDREILSRLPMPDLDKFNIETRKSFSKEDLRRALSTAPSMSFEEPPQIPDYPPADAELVHKIPIRNIKEFHENFGDPNFEPRPGAKTKHSKKLAPAPAYIFPLDPCEECGCNMVMGEWRWIKTEDKVLVGMECGGFGRHRRVVELEPEPRTVMAACVRPGDVIVRAGGPGPETVVEPYCPEGWFQVAPGTRVYCAEPTVSFQLLRRGARSDG